MLLFIRNSSLLGLVGVGMGFEYREDSATQGLMMVGLTVIFLLLACNQI